jgi:putative ABC transport system permease protein
MDAALRRGRSPRRQLERCRSPRVLEASGKAIDEVVVYALGRRPRERVWLSLILPGDDVGGSFLPMTRGTLRRTVTKLVGRDGKIIGGGPYFGVGHDSRTPGGSRLSPFKLESGRWPAASGEVVIDAASAQKQHWHVGDPVPVLARGPAETYRISGIATFGSVKSLGTATFTVFDLTTAQRVLGRSGSYDSILVGAKPAVSAAHLRDVLSAALPHSARVSTAAAQDRFGLDQLRQFVKILEAILLAFGGVSIFLGSFTIFNTFSITVAQRSRELALLRTIGSSRSQVLGAVVLEALVMGILASATGVVSGWGWPRA